MRLCLAARGLAYCAVMATMVAKPALGQTPVSMPMVSINDYRMMRNGMDVDDKPSTEALFFFVVGLRFSLMALDDTYVAAGAKRRICISPTAETFDLIRAIDEERQKNAAHWDNRKGESIVPVAIQAFARKWPCK